MTKDELHLRQTADFVVKNVSSYDQLNSPAGEYDRQFTRQLAAILKKTPLQPTNKRGAYFQLHLPQDQNGEQYQLAVKLTDRKSHMFYPAEKRRENTATVAELQAILDDPAFFYLEYRQGALKFEDLTEEEKMLAFLALEHKRYEKYYSPYILPAVFVGYEREVDKKSEKTFAMVQDFKDLGPSVFTLERSQLTEDQRQQVMDLANKIEQTFNETGFFPDENMASRSNKSENLRFSKTGHLFLIDSNHLVHKDFVAGASTYYVKILRDIANNVPERFPRRPR
jgi:hypothetical protein